MRVLPVTASSGAACVVHLCCLMWYNEDIPAAEMCFFVTNFPFALLLYIAN